MYLPISAKKKCSEQTDGAKSQHREIADTPTSISSACIDAVPSRRISSPTVDIITIRATNTREPPLGSFVSLDFWAWAPYRPQTRNNDAHRSTPCQRAQLILQRSDNSRHLNTADIFPSSHSAPSTPAEEKPIILPPSPAPIYPKKICGINLSIPSVRSKATSRRVFS